MNILCLPQTDRLCLRMGHGIIREKTLQYKHIGFSLRQVVGLQLLQGSKHEHHTAYQALKEPRVSLFTMLPSQPYYVLILATLFLMEWIALAIHPLYRNDWFLKKMLLFLFVPILVLTYQRFPFSKISYTLLFIFGSLHIVSAHYTYA